MTQNQRNSLSVLWLLGIAGVIVGVILLVSVFNKTKQEKTLPPPPSHVAEQPFEEENSVWKPPVVFDVAAETETDELVGKYPRMLLSDFAKKGIAAGSWVGTNIIQTDAPMFEIRFFTENKTGELVKTPIPRISIYPIPADRQNIWDQRQRGLAYGASAETALCWKFRFPVIRFSLDDPYYSKLLEFQRSSAFLEPGTTYVMVVNGNTPYYDLGFYYFNTPEHPSPGTVSYTVVRLDQPCKTPPPGWPKLEDILPAFGKGIECSLPESLVKQEHLSLRYIVDGKSFTGKRQGNGLTVVNYLQRGKDLKLGGTIIGSAGTREYNVAYVVFNVNKRQVKIPDDADLYLPPSERIPFKISVTIQGNVGKDLHDVFQTGLTLTPFEYKDIVIAKGKSKIYSLTAIPPEKVKEMVAKARKTGPPKTMDFSFFVPRGKYNVMGGGVKIGTVQVAEENQIFEFSVK